MKECFKPLPNGWAKEDSVRCTFHVSDTSHRYAFFFSVRHNNDYPFNNLWLKINITSPDLETKSDNINLSLAQNNIGWKGKGFMNIFQENIFWRTFQPKQKGNFSITCKQFSRLDTLKEINSFSILVRKYNNVN